jgi:hypothetical protein
LRKQRKLWRLHFVQRSTKILPRLKNSPASFSG